MRDTTTLATHAVETGAPLFLLVHYRHDAEKHMPGAEPGLVQLRRRQWHEAAASFKACLEESSSQALGGAAHSMLAKVQIAHRNHTTALRDFAAALENFEVAELPVRASRVRREIAKLFAAWGWQEQAAALSAAEATPAAPEEAEAT